MSDRYPMQQLMGACGAYCPRDGVCVLEAGHAGLHDTKYCQWEDAESLSREEADALLAKADYRRNPRRR